MGDDWESHSALGELNDGAEFLALLLKLQPESWSGYQVVACPPLKYRGWQDAVKEVSRAKSAGRRTCDLH